ncbi:chromosome partitioning protein ParA [Vibrio sp. 10N.261.51.F12]|uniref:chromosome partitioning protein ParA n=1 Tax=Vibrio sp. 10N.261.51.F12 TaxID=3229679 RepID=UPI00354BB444
MVSIQGLPTVYSQQRTNKAKRKQSVSGTSTSKSATQTNQSTQVTKVAQAVANSVNNVSTADIDRANIQYDLPEGRSKKALESYMNVMNRAKREELEQLFGVDMYV